MSDELKKKSAKELLDISVEIIKEYRILFDKILGKTPDEIQEMHKILEGLNSREIRDALRTYRGRHTKNMEIQEMHKILEGLNLSPGVLEQLKALNSTDLKKAVKYYRRTHLKNG